MEEDKWEDKWEDKYVEACKGALNLMNWGSVNSRALTSGKQERISITKKKKERWHIIACLKVKEKVSILINYRKK